MNEEGMTSLDVMLQHSGGFFWSFRFQERKKSPRGFVSFVHVDWRIGHTLLCFLFFVGFGFSFQRASRANSRVPAVRAFDTPTSRARAHTQAKKGDATKSPAATKKETKVRHMKSMFSERVMRILIIMDEIKLAKFGRHNNANNKGGDIKI